MSHDERNAEPQRIPMIGDKFPSIEITTTHGIKKIPGDYAGKWLLLFSHPADFTPVCTTEFFAFAKRYEEFKKYNCELIGLSIDQVFAHIKWVEWMKDNLSCEVPFPIIADSGEVATRLGMVHPGKGTNTVRAVFILDPHGVIRLILYYPQEVGRNVDELLRVIKAFQVSDENKVAMPAGWPNNELIGDKVIVPPPKTVEDAYKRKSQHEGYDWWFCYRKL